jgi:hypothetical protein
MTDPVFPPLFLALFGFTIGFVAPMAGVIGVMCREAASVWVYFHQGVLAPHMFYSCSPLCYVRS